MSWLKKTSQKKQPWELNRSEFVQAHQGGPKDREDYASAWVPIRQRGEPGIEFVQYRGSLKGAGVYRWNDEEGIGRGIVAVDDDKKITDIAVQRQYRGRGIGQALLSKAREDGIFEFKGEATAQGLSAIHRNSVAHAIQSGMPVPPEVLKDYPDLQGKENELA